MVLSPVLDYAFPDKKYFWFAFLFTFVGYLMVTALPDRKQDKASVGSVQALCSETDDSPGHVDKNEVTPFVSPVAPADAPVVTPLPTVTEDQIQCPVCGKLQRANRTVCWECGAKFGRL